jgi:hypothetical protein
MDTKLPELGNNLRLTQRVAGGQLQPALCGTHIDNLAFAPGLWNRQALFSKALNVKRNRVLDKLQDFLSRRSDGGTARQVGNVGAPAAFAVFEDDRVTHFHLIKLELSLFQD